MIFWSMILIGFFFSGVSLLSLEGNLFDTKSLDTLPGRVVTNILELSLL